MSVVPVILIGVVATFRAGDHLQSNVQNITNNRQITNMPIVAIIIHPTMKRVHYIHYIKLSSPKEVQTFVVFLHFKHQNKSSKMLPNIIFLLYPMVPLHFSKYYFLFHCQS